jgi:hypothetical protein
VREASVQLFISVLSETKLVIIILLGLAIHGIAQGSVPNPETGCGRNIISLESGKGATKVCRKVALDGKTNLITIDYTNGAMEHFAIIRDRVISDSGSAATHELTLKSYSADGSLSGEVSVALETVTEDSIVQIKGSTPGHINFDARLFKAAGSAQTETL